MSGLSLSAKVPLPEQQAVGFLYRHTENGARLFHILPEKAAPADSFALTLTFQTPPADNTGAAHIVEHCVFCGSVKYPVKDAFTPLLSLPHTYANAITYRDKTVYPVASYEAGAFAGLADVYLDAVFHPLFPREKGAFLQEGRRHTAKGLSGIAYNEMRGAYADALYAAKAKAYALLFPDNGFGYDAAGCPDQMGTLSFDAVTAYYRRHYHADNCRVFLYGDVPDSLLQRVGDSLSHAPRGIAPAAARQRPLQTPEYMVFTGVAAGSKEPWAGAFFVVGDSADTALCQASTVYMEALLAPGGLLRGALESKGWDVGLRYFWDADAPQAVMGFVINADVSPQAFQAWLEAALDEVMRKTDLDKALAPFLQAAAFGLQEEDYGYKPKGVAYPLIVLPSWLYGNGASDEAFFSKALFRREQLAAISRHGGEGLRRWLADKLCCNPHSVFMGSEAATQKRKAGEKAAGPLTCGQWQAEEAEFARYQQKPDRPGCALPRAQLKDMKEAILPLEVQRDTENGIALYIQDGTGYADFIWDASCVTREEAPYLSLLASLIEQGAGLGAASLTVASCTLRAELGLYRTPAGEWPGLTIRTQFLPEMAQRLFDTVGRLCREDVLAAAEKELSLPVFELYLQNARQASLAGAQGRILAQGHEVAIRQAQGLISPAADFLNRASGMEYLLNDPLANITVEELRYSLSRVWNKILRGGCLRIHVTGAQEAQARSFCRKLPLQAGVWYEGDNLKDVTLAEPPKTRPDAYFSIAGGVGYAASAVRVDHYTGGMAVAAELLTQRYLTPRRRLQNGAYDCAARVGLYGYASLHTLRDAMPRESLADFKQTGRYLQSLSITTTELSIYQMAALNRLLAPRHRYAKFTENLRLALAGVTTDDLLRQQEEIQTVTTARLRNWGEGLEQKTQGHCVLSAE